MGKAQEAPPPQGEGKEEGWEGTKEGKLEDLGERQAGMLGGSKGEEEGKEKEMKVRQVREQTPVELYREHTQDTKAPCDVLCKL